MGGSEAGVKAPKVSVLMAVHNGEPYLRQAVESILGQTFTNFEFIIVDDGSTDDSWPILNEYAARDPRIVLQRNKENIGLTRSLNRGLAAAQGEYIARQDADDISLPQRLEVEARYLDAHPDVVLVTGNFQVINSAGNVTWQTQKVEDPDLIAWQLLFHNYLGGHSLVMFRKQAVLALGGYALTRPYGQDYELWLRLIDVGKVKILPDIMLQWRSGSDNISTRKRLEQEAYALIDSGIRLADMLGDSLSMADVIALKGFWSDRFPDARLAGWLSKRLKRLYQVFVRQQALAEAQKIALERQLQACIGAQYFRWMLFLIAHLQLLTALNVLRYALLWHPPGFMMTGWIRQIAREAVFLRRRFLHRQRRNTP